MSEAFARVTAYLDELDHAKARLDIIHVTFNEKELLRSDLRELLDRLERSYSALQMRDMLEAAWEAGRDSVLVDLMKPIDENGKRPATPNPWKRS
jgi:hypothetical protein